MSDTVLGTGDTSKETLVLMEQRVGSTVRATCSSRTKNKSYVNKWFGEDKAGKKERSE